MLQLRRAKERGHTRIGWLDSWHTFSFGDYYDPRHQGFRVLRVINEDRVAPGQGFGTHPHRDMEILTWVLEGELAHKDSLGTGSIIKPGDLQRMTAGTGVLHSEHNHSDRAPVHFLQIWLLPERSRLQPGYEQRTFDPASLRGRLRLIASRDGRDDSITVHQDVDLHAATLAPGDQLAVALRPGRHAWLQVVTGAVALNGTPLAAGDGAAASDEKALELAAAADASVLLFDLP